MQILPIGNGQRCFPERRALEGEPPPGQPERRIQAERRGFEVVELRFDEMIVLGASPEELSG
ncbi:MAG: hypothetical protein LBE85_10525 [Candidatus Accumulibacter sp.]|jgi:hypothetical protein|nr:hypothetical protein [Accumulibacter sp.]